eukprot:scaffold965_cov120-Isochrysis_galbana.AAC.6
MAASHSLSIAAEKWRSTVEDRSGSISSRQQKNCIGTMRSSRSSRCVASVLTSVNRISASSLSSPSLCRSSARRRASWGMPLSRKACIRAHVRTTSRMSRRRPLSSSGLDLQREVKRSWSTSPPRHTDVSTSVHSLRNLSIFCAARSLASSRSIPPKMSSSSMMSTSASCSSTSGLRSAVSMATSTTRKAGEQKCGSEQSASMARGSPSSSASPEASGPGVGGMSATRSIRETIFSSR